MLDPALQAERYSRQTRFASLGEHGQALLAQARVLVCGCGALGSASAELLVRAGVGFVRVVDRDYLELHNLQRQTLYDEADVASGLPKAAVAERKLRAINSQVMVQGVVADLNYRNVLELSGDVQLIVDGLDNFETRFLIDEAARKLNIPWVYGGCLGSEGQVLVNLPGEPGGFRALVPEIPPPGSTPTCDTAGVLGPVVQMVAALQAMEAIKLLCGALEHVNRYLTVIDVWGNRLRQIDPRTLPAPADGANYPWLTGQLGGDTAILCGRNAVQLAGSGTRCDPLQLAQQLTQRGLQQVQANAHLVRCQGGNYHFTLFKDGRIIVVGTTDPIEAKTAAARWVGV